MHLKQIHIKIKAWKLTSDDHWQDLYSNTPVSFGMHIFTDMSHKWKCTPPQPYFTECKIICYEYNST